MGIQKLYDHFLQSTGVTTDTRKIEQGQIYFALKGERFDGNQYAHDALKAGAGLAVIDDEKYHVEGQTFLVNDVLETLQKLANYHRNQFSIPFIGITGSNGKTTTKELVQVVLKQKYNVLATIGNLNNHIGVPLTLLRLNKSHEIAIIEMGANHVHEIGQLCEIAEPDYGIITSIGRAHIGEFGSFEAIKKTKAELYQWVANHEGKAFLNTDVEVLTEMADRSEIHQRITYGSDGSCQYSYQYLGSNPFVKFSIGEVEVATQLPGEYNYHNFITAAAVGQYFDVEISKIKEALSLYQSDNNRSQIVKKESLTLIMDAYNANPSSMESALQNLKNMNSVKKGAVLGHMLELGEYSLKEHQHIVDLAESLELDFLVLVGKEFENTQVSNNTLKFPDALAAKEWWNLRDLSDYLVLIKGSRGIQLEKVVN